jgi:hypothetical protein
MSVEIHTHKKFEHIFKVTSSDSFLKMDALGGEIPFWIAPYDVSAQNFVENEIPNLELKLKNGGFSPLVLDLFSLASEVVDEHIGLDKMFAVEKRKKKEKFKRALQSTVNIHERLVPLIEKKVSEVKPQMLFIKGVGSVYPFIRSHTVLNNLQSAITDIPTVMFFPGEYSGQALNLFGLLKDDNYYRAFNIDNYKL